MIDDGSTITLGLVDRDIGLLPEGATEIGANLPEWASRTGNIVRRDLDVDYSDMDPAVRASWGDRLRQVPGSHSLQYNAVRYSRLHQPLGPQAFAR